MNSALEYAIELQAARLNASPVPLLSERVKKFDWDFARQIARASDQLRLSAGQQQVGWKLGWTSEAMRLALGIDRPNWGTLWEDQVVSEEVRLDSYIHPKIEPELVWRCPNKLTGPSVKAEEILEMGGEWAIGLELVDPRFPSYRFDALDNTADNSSAAGIRLGEFWPLPTGLDPAEIEVRFSDGVESRTGLGAQAMGSPAEAVGWLVAQLAAEGSGLKPGDVVFTGGLTAPFDLEADHAYSLVDSLGHQVLLNVT